MGTDLYGTIEVREADGWRGVDDAGPHIDRDYDVFGCLFGVRNFADFEPLFADRGLPADASPAARSEHDDDAEHTTWATLAELEAIDLDQRARGPDRRVHVFEPQPDGSERLTSKVSDCRELDGHRDALARDGVVRIDGLVYRTVTLTRRDALDGGRFPELLSKLRELTVDRAPEDVRLVVWFDS